MREKNIKSYLRKLETALWLRGLSNADTLAEVESHLQESVRARHPKWIGPGNG